MTHDKYLPRKLLFEGTKADRLVNFPSPTVADNGTTYYEIDTGILAKVLQGQWLEINTSAISPSPHKLFSVVTKTGNYSATVNDQVILCDASGGAIIITLPPAGTSTGVMLYIKKIDSSVNIVTIDGDTTDLIDGDLSVDIVPQYESLTMVCDGATWHVV